MKIHPRTPYPLRIAAARVGWEQRTEEAPCASYEHRQLATLPKKYRVSVPGGSYGDISR